MRKDKRQTGITMTTTEIRKRLEIVTKQRWPRDPFMEFYEVDLWAPDSAVGAQFREWAGGFQNGKKVLGAKDVDRWMFERFIVQREWMPQCMVADQLAISSKDLENVLRAMERNNYISKLVIQGEVPGMYPKSLVRNLPKRLPSFSRKTFSSQSSFVRAFHDAIKKDLKGVSVHLELCSASKALNEKPPDVAYERDIITRQPIGISHQVWLAFGKPLALKPDACSIFTFVQHEKVLLPFSMGGRDDRELEAARTALRRMNKG